MELSRRFDGKKFMWDGQTYDSKGQALEAAGKYEAQGFQFKLLEEEGASYVFTRREIKEPVVSQ